MWYFTKICRTKSRIVPYWDYSASKIAPIPVECLRGKFINWQEFRRKFEQLTLLLSLKYFYTSVQISPNTILLTKIKSVRRLCSSRLSRFSLVRQWWYGNLDSPESSLFIFKLNGASCTATIYYYTVWDVVFKQWSQVNFVRLEQCK